MNSCTTKPSNAMQSEKLLWTRPEAAKRLSIGLRTLDKLIAEGRIGVIRIGASVRLTEESCLRFIESQQ